MITMPEPPEPPAAPPVTGAQLPAPPPPPVFVVPTVALSSLIITPEPDPTTPVNPEPSPTKEDAVTTPLTFIPAALKLIVVDTPELVTCERRSSVIKVIVDIFIYRESYCGRIFVSIYEQMPNLMLDEYLDTMYYYKNHRCSYLFGRVDASSFLCAAVLTKPSS